MKRSWRFLRYPSQFPYRRLCGFLVAFCGFLVLFGHSHKPIKFCFTHF